MTDVTKCEGVGNADAATRTRWHVTMDTHSEMNTRLCESQCSPQDV